MTTEQLQHETISTRRDGGVLVVTLDRPDRLNAINQAMQNELHELWRSVREDASVRSVVMTGNGRAFSAGADTSDLSAGNRPEGIGIDSLNFCPGRVLDVPVIVAVNGMCVGGALNFIADGDIVIMAEDAFITDPHVTMGQVSGPEVLQIAGKVNPRAVATMALCGSAYRLRPDAALRAGIVSEVVPTDEVVDRAVELAGMIGAQSPTAVRQTLAILRRRGREPIAAELDDAWSAVVSQWGHPDAAEGPAAFIEKRPVQWADPLTAP